MSGDEIRVLVVDDHPIWVDAVARDLGQHFDVVGTANDGAKALRIVGAAKPDVVVLDLHLPDLTGVEVISRLPEGPRVLVLSASAESDDVLAAVLAGASGYLLKSSSTDELVDAVRRTAAGEAVFTPSLAGLVLGEYRRLSSSPKPSGPTLTPRETEILRLVAKGLTYVQIAERLVLSVRTVQNHVQNTLGKLQLNNKGQLVRYAIQAGLDDDV